LLSASQQPTSLQALLSGSQQPTSLQALLSASQQPTSVQALLYSLTQILIDKHCGHNKVESERKLYKRNLCAEICNSNELDELNWTVKHTSQ